MDNKTFNVKKKIDRKAVYTNAWKIAREMANKQGGKATKYFAESLRKAWENAEKTALITIPDWFMEQNNNFASQHCRCISTFHLSDIYKATDKALLVKLSTINEDGVYNAKCVKTVWVPKSILAVC